MPDSSPALEALGWDERLADLAGAASFPSARPGRVARVDRGLVTVLTAAGADRAVPPADTIATGDWVLLEDGDVGPAVVAILPRRSAFIRGDPMEGTARGPQVVAANIDTTFIVHSLTNGPNPRRLERELVLVYDSGAMPVVVLTKADLVPVHVDAERTVHRVAPSVDVIVTSAASDDGIDDLRRFAGAPHTVALIGASGVGKSTLVNRLAGEKVQAIGDVRERDQRGRHTTTARELVLLPGAGVLIDTPGLRAVALWDADDGFSRTFMDIEALARRCRFNDCAHRSEPGCAVQAAIDSGELDAGRLDNYRRLDRELDAVARRQEERGATRAYRRVPKRP
jgi:ribosome biogenesis GTPase / thiamine phosphate phosphatase